MSSAPVYNFFFGFTSLTPLHPTEGLTHIFHSLLEVFIALHPLLLLLLFLLSHSTSELKLQVRGPNGAAQSSQNPQGELMIACDYSLHAPLALTISSAWLRQRSPRWSH